MYRSITAITIFFTIGCFIGLGVWTHHSLNEVDTMAKTMAQEWSRNPIIMAKALVQGAETVNRQFESEVQIKARELVFAPKSIERLIISVVSFALLAVIALVLFDMMIIIPIMDAVKRVASATRGKIQAYRFERAKTRLEKALAQVEAMRNNIN
jgi:hypothetical protein